MPGAGPGMVPGTGTATGDAAAGPTPGTAAGRDAGKGDPASCAPLPPPSSSSSPSCPTLPPAPGEGRGASPGADTPPARRREPLWMCLRLPHLALESALHGADDEGTPKVVVEGMGAQGRVVDLNASAARAGIGYGMGLNAAYALAPWLLTIAFDEGQVHRALERLAGWAMRFTSLVSPCPPDALLLEVGGSLRLFGGYDALAQRVHQDLRRLGYSVTTALAPTPHAAVLLARDRQRRAHAVFHGGELAGALGRLDIACLRWPDRITERLRGMGVQRLGDCLRLPRDGFARRFGRARLQELDRAVGREPDPVTPWQAPLRFASRFELPAPMQAAHLLEIALARLLGELEGFLVARQAAVRRLRVDLLLEDRTVQPLALQLATPVTDAAYLMDLLRERLDQQRLQAPVVELALLALEVATARPGNGDLFERAPRVEEDAQRLLERLRTRLGAHNVHGITQVADHRPEAAWHRVEPGTPATATAARRRPLWMLHRSQGLAVDAAGQPCRRPGTAALTLEAGPERIESGWWDGADIRRDYYVARDAQGERLWIYRDRRSGQWHLHGIFA